MLKKVDPLEIVEILHICQAPAPNLRTFPHSLVRHFRLHGVLWRTRYSESTPDSYSITRGRCQVFSLRTAGMLQSCELFPLIFIDVDGNFNFIAD